MASHNSINTDIYPAIEPKNFTGKLKGKVVFITGAAQGIGQGIAIAMAKAGATLALVDLKKEKLESTVKQCEELGSKVLPLEANVVDQKAVDKALDEYFLKVGELMCRTEEKLGEIDVLVNNAGTNYRRPYHMMTFEEFWNVIEINFKAVCFRTMTFAD